MAISIICGLISFRREKRACDDISVMLTDPPKALYVNMRTFSLIRGKGYTLPMGYVIVPLADEIADKLQLEDWRSFTSQEIAKYHGIPLIPKVGDAKEPVNSNSNSTLKP